MEFDITNLKQKVSNLRAQGEKISDFVVILQKIAITLSKNPTMNSIRSRYRIIYFEDVDINIPVEIESEEGMIPRQVVIRKANTKSPENIYDEISSARAEQKLKGSTGEEDKWAMKLMKILFFLPRFVRGWIVRSLSKKPFLIKKQSGTTLITSVSKFISGSGYVIPYISSPRAVCFALGSETRKSVLLNGKIVERDIINITIIFNHDIVDGAEAARFTNQLKHLIED